jgi:2-polyprenyl-6-methoxyphenol hydroxylase-like FAD-dependent oxidoreductase
MDSPAAKKRILILGGGFAGAYTALHLEKQLASAPDVEIVLVSRENFVLFTPMLHEVAGADVAVTDIVQPLRKVLRRTRIAIGCIEAIDLANKQVRVRSEGLARAFDFTYDQLVPRLWGSLCWMIRRRLERSCGCRVQSFFSCPLQCSPSGCSTLPELTLQRVTR